MIVLIVEDDSDLAKLWVRYLQTVTTGIRVAHDLPAALVAMRAVPHPDIVLLDLRLPGSKPLNTLQHIAEMKEINPKAVVVVLTGAIEEKLPELAAQLGADGFGYKRDHATSQRNLLLIIADAIKRRSVAKGPIFEPALSVLETLSALTSGLT